ncbi:hypothetical protein CICLE_v10028400mg [Citrus x clementina]|uniref:PGG domain-containing protein n=1 Tax=Citrus clementina TaxID=85681 RepID=V4UER7_CITCL|nr:hypothetical protein CICLE_v10028400mg [Citrus x clementina]
MCSVIEDTGSKHKINAELYNALLIREDEQKVIELCRKVPDHALYILTIHHDTVLHMATYSKKRNLVLKLLDELPDQYLDKMTRQNQAGNTILHETATSNLAIPVAEKLLKKEPGLLGMRNNNGETALLRAARYGKADIFNFLARRVSGYDLGTKLPFLHRNDKTNVLHIAILSQHFDLALQIAHDYWYLIEEQDVDGMTALQLLACKLEAFDRKRAEGFFNKLIYCGERVEEVSIPHFRNHRNNMGFTPEELFATANNELRTQSKEWLKHTADRCLAVAIFVGTVAFFAAYTVPGGANVGTGYPILLHHPFFATFAVSNVLSLTFALAAGFTFLSILSSPYRLQDFKQSLPNKLTLGFTFLFLSACLMTVAFAATILLMIKNKEHWAKILLYTCSIIPVGIFTLSYFSNYVTKSIARSCKKFCSKTGLPVPQFFVSLLKRIFCFSKCLNDKTTGSSIP